jgi:hypothetical protein
MIRFSPFRDLLTCSLYLALAVHSLIVSDGTEVITPVLYCLLGAIHGPFSDDYESSVIEGCPHAPALFPRDDSPAPEPTVDSPPSC